MDPRWLVVGNLVRRRYRADLADVRTGTKHFHPGAKLRIVGDYPGMCERVVVVGRSRLGRYITVAMPVWWLTSLRVSLEYSPAVLERAAGARTYASQAEAEERCEVYRLWIEAEREARQRTGHPWWVVEE